jgi:hypothetical protein
MLIRRDKVFLTHDIVPQLHRRDAPLHRTRIARQGDADLIDLRPYRHMHSNFGAQL